MGVLVLEPSDWELALLRFVDESEEIFFNCVEDEFAAGVVEDGADVLGGVDAAEAQFVCAFYDFVELSADFGGGFANLHQLMHVSDVICVGAGKDDVFEETEVFVPI